MLCNSYIYLCVNVKCFVYKKYFIYHIYIYISSVYSPFSDRVGLPLLNIPSSGVLNEEYWRRVFTTGCPFWCQPHTWDAVSNSSKYCILSGTQLIQLYKFVCTIPTQTITLIYILNRPLVASYDIPG